MTRDSVVSVSQKDVSWISFEWVREFAALRDLVSCALVLLDIYCFLRAAPGGEGGD